MQQKTLVGTPVFLSVYDYAPKCLNTTHILLIRCRVVGCGVMKCILFVQIARDGGQRPTKAKGDLIFWIRILFFPVVDDFLRKHCEKDQKIGTYGENARNFIIQRDPAHHHSTPSTGHPWCRSLGRIQHVSSRHNPPHGTGLTIYIFCCNI